MIHHRHPHHSPDQAPPQQSSTLAGGDPLLVPVGAPIDSPTSSHHRHNVGPTSSSSSRMRISNMAGHRSSKSTSTFSNDVCRIVLLAMILALAVAGTVGWWAWQDFMHHYELKIRQEIAKQEVEPLTRNLKSQMQSLQDENTELKQQVDQLKQQKAAADDESDESENKEKLEKLEKRVNHLVDYKSKMQKAVQLLSKRSALEKYGQGPHRVEIMVQIDPADQPAKNEMQRILIELAPVQDMPHTVYYFLEHVVRYKTFDGCSFHRNAPHVVQGGPAANFLTPPEGGRLQYKFTKTGIPSVLFQEYSAKHPHVKYTLGLAGRPGGPDFYVSTQDNTRSHGPGGQDSYSDPSEADPCFAKVLEGFDVVDQMHALPVEPGGYKHLKHNVAIISMRLLNFTQTDGSEELEISEQ